jgi:hypothetical protein
MFNILQLWCIIVLLLLEDWENKPKSNPIIIGCIKMFLNSW